MGSTKSVNNGSKRYCPFCLLVFGLLLGNVMGSEKKTHRAFGRPRGAWRRFGLAFVFDFLQSAVVF